MIQCEDHENVARFITPQESAELNHIRQDPSVVGYTVVSSDGVEIEAHGAFEGLSGPVFANIIDIVDKMGEELGETDTCPIMFMEGSDYEAAVLSMSSAKAVIIRRRQRQQVRGLTSVR